MPGALIGLIFVALLGACAGSFLNVVIYRLPRDLSPSAPARSFCPSCESRIAWYDNIPVVSWLILSGRCRRCGSGISVGYPIVELLSAAAAVVLFDALFLSRLRAGIGPAAGDWPIGLAYAVLIWGLIAASTIDIEHYSIDLRITWLVVGMGVAMHTLWASSERPEYPFEYPRPWDGTALASMGAVAGLVVVWLLRLPRYRAESTLEMTDERGLPVGPPPGVRRREPAPGVGLRVAVVVGAATVAALVAVAGVAAATGRADQDFWVRALLSAALGFAAIVGAGMAWRQADQEIVEAIEKERHDARRRMVRELVMLAPAVWLAVLAAALVGWSDGVARWWSGALGWAPIGSWRPVLGVCTSLSGFAAAGAIGWGVRIVFTLALGKEAFGMGDVHLMAAAGAVVGWPTVLIGFFLASPLALAGVLILLVRKRTRAIPFGPWLSLGVWIAVLYYERIVGWAAPFLSAAGDGYGPLGRATGG